MGIEIVDVEKRFGSVVAVRDFSLRVEPGELLAIVGPSGCGKTTLLRIIAGLEQADAGRVAIGGRDATHLPPEKRHVGFVFQQFALFPNMTVAENIAYGLRRRRVPRHVRERRVAELLAMIDMEGYDRRRPHQLSSGQQQRVALARALAPEPRTLLLDEPLSALDAAIRYQLRNELRRVQRRTGITTIMVTHDQEEALAIADRVVVMNEGRLEQVGLPWELYDRPRTQFVARFIGRGNFLQGELIDNVVHSGSLLHGEGPRAKGTEDKSALAGVHVPGLGVWPIPQDWTEQSQVDTPITSRPGGDSDAVRNFGRDRSSVTILVRPESIVIAHSAVEVEPYEDAFVGSALVQDIVFAGERAHVQLQLVSQNGPGVGGPEGGPQLVAATPSRDVPHIVDRIGQPVTVVIPYDAVRLLPD